MAGNGLKSAHDRRVFRNSRINILLKEDKRSILYKEILPGYDKMQVIFIGDPAYPLLRYCMKEYGNVKSNEELIFDNMLRSTRNLIECAFERLKVRWQILI